MLIKYLDKLFWWHIQNYTKDVVIVYIYPCSLCKNSRVWIYRKKLTESMIIVKLLFVIMVFVWSLIRSPFFLIVCHQSGLDSRGLCNLIKIHIAQCSSSLRWPIWEEDLYFNQIEVSVVIYLHLFSEVEIHGNVNIQGEKKKNTMKIIYISFNKNL